MSVWCVLPSTPGSIASSPYRVVTGRSYVAGSTLTDSQSVPAAETPAAAPSSINAQGPPPPPTRAVHRLSQGFIINEDTVVMGELERVHVLASQGDPTVQRIWVTMKQARARSLQPKAGAQPVQLSLRDGTGSYNVFHHTVLERMESCGDPRVDTHVDGTGIFRPEQALDEVDRSLGFGDDIPTTGSQSVPAAETPAALPSDSSMNAQGPPPPPTRAGTSPVHRLSQGLAINDSIFIMSELERVHVLASQGDPTVQRIWFTMKQARARFMQPKVGALPVRLPLRSGTGSYNVFHHTALEPMDSRGHTHVDGTGMFRPEQLDALDEIVRAHGFAEKRWVNARVVGDYRVKPGATPFEIPGWSRDRASVYHITQLLPFAPQPVAPVATNPVSKEGGLLTRWSIFPFKRTNHD